MEVIFTTGVVFVTTFLAGIFIFFKWSYKYWERKNIPFKEPVIPSGSITNFLLKQDEQFGIKIGKLYETAKSAGCQEYGIYVLWKPIYMPIDPKIIKQILSVDFNTFVDRGIYYNKKTDPLSAHLFSLDGHEWRNVRSKLTPTFTSGKMKMMILTVIQCGKQLKKSVDHLVFLSKPIDIKEVVGQYTTDVIGSCAFGIDCNSFENPNSEFIKHSKQVFQETTKRRMKNFFGFVCSKLAKQIGLTTTEDDTSKFFLSLVEETAKYREANNIIRNDFMQLLLNLKNESEHEGYRFNLEEISAQAFLFFVAGYETSSTTMTFCLFELAQNFEIQEKVREEIEDVLEKYGEEVTYEAFMEMKYMGQIIDETLRKYPPAPILVRQNNADYKLQGSEQILDKGTCVFISCMGLHHDPEYFPDPKKFDPDRFSQENKSKIKPYTYLPFGEGPRNCIGLRFAIMQMKIALIYLLKNYKFSLNERTKIPVVMDTSSHTLNAVGGIWLNVTNVD